MSSRPIAFDSRYLTEVAFSLVKQILAESAPDAGWMWKLRFEWYRSREYDAFVEQPQSDRPTYLIGVSEGLSTEVVGSLASAAGEDMTLGLLGGPEADLFGLGDGNTLLNLVLMYALTFVTLHEVAHIGGGHIAYWSEHFGEDEGRRFSEATHSGIARVKRRATERAGPLSEDDFSRISELEADGLALEMTLEWCADIAMSLTDSRVDESLREAAAEEGETRRFLWRAALAGCLGAIALLEQGRARTRDELDQAYPFPEARLLNLVTIPLKLSAGSGYRVESGEELISYAAPAVQEGVIRMVRDVYLPTSAFVATAFARDGIDPLITASAPGSAVPQPFVQDVSSLVTDGQPHRTQGGRELVELMRLRKRFVAALAPHRIMRWWE